ncbi:hypothetical protein DCAR_0730044 [Daucus carota subsp. sativus]|uniref:DUF7792 domain-containing protein n=1 Tax=Daucus carota subsp. sativus TaxID=79200 RepID=A0A164UML6_DAUCS|nr:PREDICTED: uncharacterized protein LOC108196772 [Daucus carota subsp. sativus]WOH10575.1 hypothetical protein DCAR_0730044 [Daucus carota subsp. sativus]
MAATAATDQDENSIQDELSHQILLAERVIKLAQEAESSKLECSDLAKQSTQLAHLLRSVVRLTSSTQSLYERPLRRIITDSSMNLDRALKLVRKCKHGGVLRLVVAITTTADFRKVSNLLESSIADIKWLISIYDSESGTNLSLPPIASNDPILAWVWSYVATIQMGQLKDRVDAANELASLARDNNRNMKIIVQEGGVAPLLKLLKDGASAEAQMAAATALYNLGTDQEKVQAIAGEVSAVPIVVKAIGESPMRVQIVLVNLVARMAELDEGVREDLGRENVTRPLVTLLGMDIVVEEAKAPSGKPSIHSLVQINKEVTKKTFHSNSSSSLSLYSDGSSRGGRKEREAESPDMKHRLKVSCAGALWKLAQGSLFNSRKITETKALVCLAKLIEKEHGELQLNCLMTVMELAAVAEANADLRQVAFKPNSPAARVILEQLLRVINEENSVHLLIPTIKSIGSLARTFPAKETRILGPLVTQLGHKSVDVATEAAIALCKFVAQDNFNCVEHSKAIIEANGVPRLMNLLKSNDRSQKHEFILLCCLAIHVSNSPALEQARALSVIEGAARSMLAHHPELRELFAKAVDHLTLYQPGAHSHHKHSYVP